MQKIAQFLLIASLTLGMCAILAGVGMGLLMARMATGICFFSSCQSRDSYFGALGPLVRSNMTPCVVIEALALVAFLAYCLVTRQPWRAVISFLFLLVAGSAGIALLNAMVQDAQANLPVGEGGILIEGSAVAWGTRFGLALTLVVFVWTGVPLLIQWRDRR